MSYQREFPEKIRVGMVGVGSHAYRNLLPTLNFLPVTLAAICDTNLELARKTAAQYGVPRVYGSATEMYRDGQLDAVLLCVSPVMHPTLAADALDAHRLDLHRVLARGVAEAGLVHLVVAVRELVEPGTRRLQQRDRDRDRLSVDAAGVLHVQRVLDVDRAGREVALEALADGARTALERVDQRLGLQARDGHADRLVNEALDGLRDATGVIGGEEERAEPRGRPVEQPARGWHPPGPASGCRPRATPAPCPSRCGSDLRS